MTGAALLFLILMEVKHCLFDFVFQTLYQARNKGTYGHRGGLLHSGLHVLGTAVVLIFFLPPLSVAIAILVGEFVVHYHIDWVKEQIMRRWVTGQGVFFWRMMGLDQLLHQLTYIAIAAILFFEHAG
jgi:hypothetical protein